MGKGYNGSLVILLHLVRVINMIAKLLDQTRPNISSLSEESGFDVHSTFLYSLYYHHNNGIAPWESPK